MVDDTDQPLAIDEHNQERRALRDYRYRRMGAIATKALYSLYVASLPLQVIQADITASKMDISDSTPIIHTIAESRDEINDDTATVFIDGFASKDGSWTTSKMIEPLQTLNDSDIWALEYSLDGISAKEIAEQIADKAATDNTSSVSLYGYSIGGMVTLEVARELISTHKLTVPTIFLDHAPADRESIRKTMRDQGSPALETISWFNSIGIEIEYSSIARSVINQLFADDMSHLNGTPTNLMRDQYLFGMNANTDEALKHISEVDAAIPNVVYITSSDPSSDYMIDLERSVKLYQESAKKYDFLFSVVAVDDAIHSRLDLTVDQYNAAFTEAAPIVQRQQEIASADEDELSDGGQDASGEKNKQ